jgi:hypothetical protein
MIGRATASSRAVRFCSVWLETWPSESPVPSPGGLEHEPPLRDDLQPVRARAGERLLRLAERYDEQPGATLEPVQAPDERVRLVDGLRAGERHAGEVDERAAQATAHHPVGRDRRVDAAGHQRDSPAAHPHRQPALPRQAAGEDEHLSLVDLDKDLGLRVAEVDREPVRLLDLAADEDGELG